jgi:NADP-dependent 3-hydroxy acid dehydrogenase YdfG
MILDRLKLNGKVAIVTGASAGIGHGSAVGLAEAGANVVMAARTADRLEAAAADVRTRVPQALLATIRLPDERSTVPQTLVERHVDMVLRSYEEALAFAAPERRGTPKNAIPA